MARKHEAAEWLTKDNSPIAIAALMGVSLETVMGYLYNHVGEGKIRRSDILFSIGAMLERYSHIRIAAKRGAVAGIRLREQIASTPQDSEVVPVVDSHLPIQ
ncbi:MAG TPA: hypothetical protein VML19_34305 [Verrucomicrobiae bacterium]|nr:hypothetical protein [Verrucomicrobiae bacterium]